MSNPRMTSASEMIDISTGPVELTEADLNLVAGGAITEEQINGGGNTPNGNANGVPTTNVNPAGKAPPGQNM